MKYVEAEHLIFGLLTGYKFVSFRVFDFKLEKDDNIYAVCERKLLSLHKKN